MNPSELTLLVLRLAFLLVLWLFIFGIVYALRSDLFGHRVRKLATDAPPAAGACANAPAGTGAGGGVANGTAAAAGASVDILRTRWPNRSLRRA